MTLPQESETVSALGGVQALRPDVHRVRLPLGNVYFLGQPGGPWVLVDAGLPGTRALIRRAAKQVHGERPPEAIVLTHGHLDHVGALLGKGLGWTVPLYAHTLELPHVTGEAPYPFPDPTVGGGMSLLSPAFVPGPFDLGAVALPAAGTVPHLPEWRWRHTPGHTAGHISLWREGDRTLIAGDAFVTTAQEKVRPAWTLRPAVVHGPPAYYTPNWDAARASVRDLAELNPDLAATGHGHPLSAPNIAAELRRLAKNFDELALPRRGWYLKHPAPIAPARAGQKDPWRTRVLAGIVGTVAALVYLRN